MADMFDALLSQGNEPDPAAIVAQLRRQNMLGQMAQLSGDRVLSPMGKQQVSGAQDMATQLNAQNARKQLRADEQAWRQQQATQAQSNADRSFGLQKDQNAINEQFRRDQLAQTAADRAAMREVSLTNAMEAANARKAASAQSGEKVARELRQERQKAVSVGSMVDEALGLLEGKNAPNTDIVSRGLRGTLEALTGTTTSGGETLGQLQSIGSLLVQNAPKLGGSMSDSDVRLYQSAAGKLEDPSIPNAVKIGALKTMKQVIARNKDYFDTELAALTGSKTPKQENDEWMSQFQVIR